MKSILATEESGSLTIDSVSDAVSDMPIPLSQSFWGSSADNQPCCCLAAKARYSFCMAAAAFAAAPVWEGTIGGSNRLPGTATSA